MGSPRLTTSGIVITHDASFSVIKFGTKNNNPVNTMVVSKMEPLSGIITALVTPFTETGELKTEAIQPLIDFQIKGGVDGLFLCGTAGLGSVMRTDQRVMMFKESAKAARGRIKLLAHVGAPSTEEAVILARAAESAVVDALGAVPPYFMKPDEESIIKHFKTVAEASKLPLYIYNIPGQAVNAVTPAMMLKLAQIPNIRGVKDSSRDFINLLNYLQVLPEDFTVICGSDSYIYPAMVMGARGAITGYANGFPDVYADFLRVIRSGDQDAAKRKQFELNVLRGKLQKPPLAPHYEALRLRGVDAGVPRAPLRGMTEKERVEFKESLMKLGVL
ncbi:dihydrodipicolinate synthase family protein [Candidatus Bathyarchaeota archaeon]|nr:MAG: dihydrodipicolinate synthase family protein [Candidatus Bathyarchaeota archaeon]